MANIAWAIVTGEYPPQPGGVSDYTRLLARSLAGHGDAVHVWAPACSGDTPQDPGVRIQRLPGHFGPRALRALSAALDQLPERRHLLVQYVPQALGWKGMNVPFCLWLLTRRSDSVWIIFHEVVFPWDGKAVHKLLAMVTRLMAWLAVGACDRAFVSIPAWEPLLRRLARRRCNVSWLPVPSNFPTIVDAEAVKATRHRMAPDGGPLVGHFGTFGRATCALLAEILPPLIKGDARLRALLIGRGGVRFACDLGGTNSSLAGRLAATGELSEQDVSTHVAACDILVQPYPDGVSSRRTSIMAGLALGAAIVTNEGPLSEPIWRETRAVRLVAATNSGAFVHATEALLHDPASRAALQLRAAHVYVHHFSIERLIEKLRTIAA